MTTITDKIFQCDELNINNRIYLMNEIKKIIETFNNSNTSMLGEFTHPQELTVSMERVSHIVENIDINEKTGEVFATVKILDTPRGLEVKKLLETSVELGLYPRGSGIVADDGTVSNYEMTAIDIDTKDD